MPFFVVRTHFEYQVHQWVEEHIVEASDEYVAVAVATRLVMTREQYEIIGVDVSLEIGDLP